MNQRLLALALKKQRLQLASAAQRAQIGQHVADFSPLFGAADGVGAAIRWVGQRPRWVLGAAVVCAALRPRLVWRWGLRGFSLWQLGRRIRQG